MVAHLALLNPILLLHTSQLHAQSAVNEDLHVFGATSCTLPRHSVTVPAGAKAPAGGGSYDRADGRL